jgi:hypothetical protein
MESRAVCKLCGKPARTKRIDDEGNTWYTCVLHDAVIDGAGTGKVEWSIDEAPDALPIPHLEQVRAVLEEFVYVLERWDVGSARSKSQCIDDAAQALARQLDQLARERAVAELEALLEGEVEAPPIGWEFMVDSQLIRNRLATLKADKEVQSE